LHQALLAAVLELGLGNLAIAVGIDLLEVDDERSGFALRKRVALTLRQTPHIGAFGVVKNCRRTAG